MKRRVAFRSLGILLAAVMLLSSTSAYNILVYANQDSVANSLSAIESSSDAAVIDPNIVVQGGSLEVNADSTTTNENTNISWKGNGTSADPYQIESVEHFMQVNAMVNGVQKVNYEDQKHFVLTTDIDLSGWFSTQDAPLKDANGIELNAGSAYLITTNPNNPNHYINLSGAYTVDGQTQYHKIYFSDSTAIDINRFDNFGIFGYLSANSVISNVVFENVNLNVTSATPRSISVIAYRNEGRISGCEINNCSITLSSSQIDGAGAGSAVGTNVENSYYGIAAAVADNRANVNAVKVNNFTVSATSATNDYIAGLIGQNRGTVEASVVSGIKLNLNKDYHNHYIGGFVAYNAADAIVTGSRVDMAGENNVTENIRGGGYVGGFVGYNDTGATIMNCSVTGSFTSAQETTSSSFNILGEAVSGNNIIKSNGEIENRACYGGIAGLNRGLIKNATVSDLGFYVKEGSVTYTGYFGGIASRTTGGKIEASVASGTIVSNPSTECYAGGIIAYAETTDIEIVSDCYALVKLDVRNTNTELVGAVVGFGGAKNTAINCYWSDAISGCVTSYVVASDSQDPEKYPLIEPIAGKLVSENRAVTISRGNEVDYSSTSFRHTFTRTESATTEPATVVTDNTVTVTGVGINNNVIKHAYSAVLTMPVDANGTALIGSSDKQNMSVWFNLDVFVTSSATGDPDDPNNPLEISSSAMIKFVSIAPYGHYKLTNSVAVLENSWDICNFTGTINGNGHSLSTEIPLFSNVIGSRDNVAYYKADSNEDESVTDPELDSADRSHGYIHDLKVELARNIETAVFGTVYDSTFINVSLTDGDPTPDDGNAEGGNGYEGYIAKISKMYTAAFINSAVGCSYIYGCSTDVSAEFGDVSDIAVFIAYVSGNVVVDNCAVTSVSAYVGSKQGLVRAVFLGNVKNNGEKILNSIVSARVVGTGSCYLVMGANRTKDSNLYKNIVWSKAKYDSNETDSSMDTPDVPLWGSGDNTYSSIQKSVTTASTVNYSITIPQNVDAFKDVTVDDFAVSLVTLTKDANSGAFVEAEYTDKSFELKNVSIESGSIVLNVYNSASTNDCVWAKVFHYETGFLTYVKFYVIETAFAKGDDGYYHISSPEDLIKFSELTAEDGAYCTYAYKIDNDINMLNYNYTPAAINTPFTGYISAKGEDGKVYTISNLTVSGTGNVALFATAAYGGEITVVDTAGGSTTVISGIYDIRIENANIKATSADSNAAVLVASSSASSSSDVKSIKIQGVEIVDSVVENSGKNSAAVLAYTYNSAANISGVKLENVAVRTGYAMTGSKYTDGTAGGVAGVIGTVSYAAANATHEVSVQNVEIDGLSLTGSAVDADNYNYAQANAGAIIGSYQRYFGTDQIDIHKLNIGAVPTGNDYNIVINNLFIKSAGIAGGAVGLTNAQTSIAGVKVSATDGNSSCIYSTTDQFIGGIAGHIGSHADDGALAAYIPDNIYGKVSNCFVENTEIVAKNPAITSSGATMSHNVAVGGIVGAINGAAEGNTVENSVVSNSLVEGVVVGGIVGSNVSHVFIDGNVIRIEGCEVLGSTVTTPENCIPRSGATVNNNTYTTDTMASFGVGGILGTNRYAQNSYASVVSVKYCNVDAETEITNFSVLSDVVYVPTGGIIGFATMYYDANDAESMVLDYNSVSASVYASADAAVTGAVDNKNITAVRTGTAGFIGMFGSITSAYNSVLTDNKTGVSSIRTTVLCDVAYIQYLHINNSVFDGSVTGADGVAGAIGSIINTTSVSSTKTSSKYAPAEPILNNLVISGSLKSLSNSDASLVRGGIAIGHIAYRAGKTGGNGYLTKTQAFAMHYNPQNATTGLQDVAFRNIHYSSLEVNKIQFPLLGYCGLNPSDTSQVYYPTIPDALTALKVSYTDVNSKSSDNTTAQLSDMQGVVNQTPVDTGSLLETQRGSFSLNNAALGTSYWESSNTSIVQVSNTTYESVTVTPKSKSENAVIISIDYLGELTDGNGWTRKVRLPVGFRVISDAEKVLDYVMVGADKYELLSEPLDFNYIKANGKYWLKNDIAFTPDLFESSGAFSGGYSFDEIFTGVFASMPLENFEVHTAGGTYSYSPSATDKAEKTISGLQYKAVSGTYSSAALFAQANGATFENFILEDVSSTAAVDYAAAVAAVINGSLTAKNITVKNADISGAKYSGGLFGGMFNAVSSDAPVWNIEDCRLEGIRSVGADGYIYSTNITGINGAAGIAVHTNQSEAVFSGVSVEGSSIVQSATTQDTSYFDNGAAGISLAFSGSIKVNGENRNVIKESSIVGEIAAGAVVRSYSSTAMQGATSDVFVVGNIFDSNVIAEYLSISAVDIIGTQIRGTHTQVATSSYNMLNASGGILARPACAGIEHSISDCSLDNTTTVEALVSVGGVVGCFEEADISTGVDTYKINLSVDNCRNHATVKTTSTTKLYTGTYYYNLGTGGIIGALSYFVGYSGINIKNCVVDGEIIGDSAVGGIIGAIWSNNLAGTLPQSMTLNSMTNHMVETCVVNAEFKTTAGEQAFSESGSTTGLIVGYVYDAALSTSNIFGAASKGLNNNNYPFYNIYYSAQNYTSGLTYLFGVLNPGKTTANSLNKYECYTDYVYDVNYFYADGEKVSRAQINSDTHALEFSKVYRVGQSGSQEKGIWVIDYRSLGEGLKFDIANGESFVFNTTPAGDTASDVTYRFDTSASLLQFVLSDSNGTSGSTTAVLKKISTDSELVSVENVSGSQYVLKTVSKPTQTFAFNIIFEYSNGLELIAPFRIEVSDGDYYFAENADGGKTYFIFNAANLNSTLQLKLSANDKVIQCFDVFWTADNATVIKAVNDYTAQTTLAQAYAGTDLLDQLKNAYHPNPDYDVKLGNAENLKISDYLGLETDESLNTVTLRRLVKEINIISYGTYGKAGDAALYKDDNGGFAGSYTVLPAAGDTGLTANGDYYGIYGLELHPVNILAQNAEATHTGLFASLASGAKITGVTFINPKIEYVGSKNTDSYAGVLAGSAEGAQIKGVSVRKLGEGTPYISAIRRMTAASVWVGGIVGYADANTSITGCSVEGLDIVAAGLAGNQTKTLKTVMAGGIAGETDGVVNAWFDADNNLVKNTSVSDCRILVERNNQYRNFYLSYAGGVAAGATGTISNVSVSNTLLRDCTCEVDTTAAVPFSTYSVENESLVADRIGGVAAFTDGSLSVSSAEVSGVTIRAFDIAGGILASAENNASATVSITDSSVGELNNGENAVTATDIRIYSSANVASSTSARQYYNAVGGVVGKVDNLSALNITSCDFNGYAGTYSYDNLNKDCTAGGLIGFVTDKLASLDSINVYDSTVSGEVVGYRSAKTGNAVPYLGAAGGIIGKINTTETRSATTAMVSDCVMGAQVLLYNNVDGTVVDANPKNPAEAEDTHMGKVLGTLVSSYTVTTEGEDGTQAVTEHDNFAVVEGKKTAGGDFTKYFNNIYVSSYPQDILVYGSRDFYAYQISPYKTYTDINKVINDQTGESEGALAIGGLDLTGITSPSYADDSYSDLAVIPLDTGSGKIASATRAFRVKYKEISFGNGNKIEFLNNASIDTTSNIGDATISVKTETLTGIGDEYYYGTLFIDKVKSIIIGEIVMDYSYGLQVNVGFIGMDITGDGSETNKFQIAKPEHLAVAFASPDKHYVQVNDIDLSEQYNYTEKNQNPLWASAEGFDPIGTSSVPFTGTYDGGGFLIENLYISDADSENIGLFGVIKGKSAESPAVVKNVHIEIAGAIDLHINPDDYSEITTVNGNVTGGKNVGGLAGRIENAEITNCSVVKGNVFGDTNVGGLVGDAKASKLTSCFTSTTTYAYGVLASDVPSQQAVGALVGFVSGSLNISNSFTLGYASFDYTSSKNYGAVGGFVGYVDSGAALTISNAFVGASVADSNGNKFGDVYYKGLTVGTASADAVVGASKVFVSAATAAGENYSNDKLNAVVNPILGSNSGNAVAEKSDVYYDTGLNGKLLNRMEKNATNKSFSLTGITLGVNDIADAYTAAYVDFAGLSISAYEKEDAERGETYQRGGLFYPVTVKGDGISVTSSTVDLSDMAGISEYPEGMDTAFYGNADSKNTDLLFKNSDNGISVYLNIFDMALDGKEPLGSYSETPYDNGELFYDYNAPYFTVTKQVGNFTLYRKVTYPVQAKYEEGVNGRFYPIATERQLNALSKVEDSGTFASFSLNSNYALVENIALGNYEFKPIAGFTGTLHGKDHTVSNVTINGSEQDNVGFFKTLTMGSVKGLHLVVNSVTGDENVGALVGYIGLNAGAPSTVKIEGCSVAMAPGGTGVNGTMFVGGLVGYAECGAAQAGIIESNTAVTVSGNNVVGGLVGYTQMFINNCYSTGNVNAKIDATTNSDYPRGIGGLAGILAEKADDSAYPKEANEYYVVNSFSSSAVDVSEVSGYNSKGNGAGGLIGNVAYGTSIFSVFSSGSVRFCYGDNVDINTLPDCTNSPAIAVGGLVGVLNSETTNVYSSASVAANVGALNSSSVVGIGGVAGISNATIQNAYSSGSTLGESATKDNLGDYNYGVGGVVGLISSTTSFAQSLYFDINVSAGVEKAIGRANATSDRIQKKDGAMTTKELTSLKVGSDGSSLLGSAFGYTDGAYPYLISFFDKDVSRVILFNALLSIVAIQLNEFDTTAADGEGVSMAMDIPTAVHYGDASYVYGFKEDNSFGDSAVSLVDESTNTLSFQRMSNEYEQANFVVTIKQVGKLNTDEQGNSSYGDYSEKDAAGVLYTSIASRPLSRICAQMLGTKDYPYLVASQQDLEHVAMSEKELAAVTDRPGDILYKKWNTPLVTDGENPDNRVYYRMMGYFTLNGTKEYNRSFTALENGYSFDGMGYSVRGLTTTLAETLKANSIITNVTFEETAFSTGESLVGTVEGSMVGVNVFGTADGSNVAGIADTVGKSGVIKGCVAALDYNGNGQSDIAGLVLKNNGTVEMSVSAGDVSGASLKNVSGLVGINNGTIKNSFTMGDMKLTSPTGVIAGFVGSNTGVVDACYTRYNIMVTDAEASKLTIGSFAGENLADTATDKVGSISASFAAGLFDVKAPAVDGAPAAPAALKNIFIAKNDGKLTDVMFDKQLSGTCFKDIFINAERTEDIITLVNHSALKATAETAGKYAVQAVEKVEYPQLTAILGTVYEAPDISAEEKAAEESGDPEAIEALKQRKEEIRLKTIEGRMYNILRSYSQLSSSAANVANDNYVDNVAVGGKTPLSFNDYVGWFSDNENVGKTTLIDSVGSGPAFEAIANGTAVAVATSEIKTFYNNANTSGLSDKINIYFTVNGEGINPNFAGGNGSQEKPYEISTKEQVVALSYYGKNSDSYFEVIKDINMTDTDWNAYIDVFKANLDGKGFTLYNITIPTKTNNALFGSLDGAVVSNLGITGINVTTSTGGASGMLAVKALNNASLTNCVVVGELNAPTGSQAGGLIGETDGSIVIDGCIVSGKIKSGAKYVGGLVGNAAEGTVISNCLSTALVIGNSVAGENSDTATGGIFGAGEAAVENCVFAGNVKGAVTGNIAGDGNEEKFVNCYFDKQLSTVDGGANAYSTYYLTQGAPSGAFGSNMSWINGFTGYPVPVALASATGEMLNAVKLASAKITLANGVGAGSSTAFTTATPSAVNNAKLAVSGDASTYVKANNISQTNPTAYWETDTGTMALGDVYGGELTYELGSMKRYIDIAVGKKVNTVTYTITDLAAGAKSILSVITGNGDSATAATAFDTQQSGTLCENMVFSYEMTGDNKVQLFRVETQLPDKFKQGNVTVVFKNSTNGSTVTTVNATTDANGVAYIAIPNDTGVFDTIEITVNAVQDNTWGIRGLFGLFR